MVFISSGILLAIFSGVLSALLKGNFLSNVDFGKLQNIPLPMGINLSTSLLFEIAIFLSVLGSISYMLSALGHPRTSEVGRLPDLKDRETHKESSDFPPPDAQISEKDFHP